MHTNEYLWILFIKLHQKTNNPDNQLLSQQLVLANPGPVVVNKLHASSFTELIGEDNIFLTVADAVHTCAPKMEEVWNHDHS